MATDYDAPRTGVADTGEESIEGLQARPDNAQSAAIDADDSVETFELPGADIIDEELTVAVLPIQTDEFRCARCFLVHHRSQLAVERGGDLICTECA